MGQDVYIDVNVILEGKVRSPNGVQHRPQLHVIVTPIGRRRGDFRQQRDRVEAQRRCEVHASGRLPGLVPGTELRATCTSATSSRSRNSAIGRGSKANHLTYLGDSSVGASSNIGAGTITCNYDGANKHRTVIGDRVFVGSGTELVAPITVADDATVGAGSTLSKDAPAGQLTLTRRKQLSLRGWRRPVKKPKD